MSTATITGKYTCMACRLVNQLVELPVRRPLEDVVHYVKVSVAACVAADHAERSPWCTSRTMTDLKIPLPKGDGRIGDA